MIKRAVLGSVVLLFAAWTYAYSQYGSLAGIVARLQGATLVLKQPRVDLGKCLVGQDYTATFEITNYASLTAVLFSKRSDCTCMKLGELPAEIPPGGTAAIDLRVNFDEPSVPRSRTVRTAVIQYRTDKIDTVIVPITATVTSPGVSTPAAPPTE
ncbi:MAG: DUF1573 domain-containing protein [Pirellulales bacterium]|nr:DUF1573 domain-containing protein [Pirellulales bacterium]